MTQIEKVMSYGKPSSQWAPRDCHCYMLPASGFSVLQQTSNSRLASLDLQWLPHTPDFFSSTALISRIPLLCAQMPLKCQYPSNGHESQITIFDIRFTHGCPQAVGPGLGVGKCTVGGVRLLPAPSRLSPPIHLRQCYGRK